MLYTASSEDNDFNLSGSIIRSFTDHDMPSENHGVFTCKLSLLYRRFQRSQSLLNPIKVPFTSCKIEFISSQISKLGMMETKEGICAIEYIH